MLREKQFERNFLLLFFVLKPGNGNKKTRELFIPTSRKRENIFLETKKETRQNRSLSYSLMHLLRASFTILRRLEGWNLQPRPFSRGISRRNFWRKFCAGRFRSFDAFNAFTDSFQLKKLLPKFLRFLRYWAARNTYEDEIGMPTIVPA